MMKVIDLFFCLIVISITVIGMEAPETGMVKINSWQDGAPFERKIVVYRNDNSIYPLAQCDASYVLNDTRLKFGFLENLFTPQGIKAGYLLIQIVKTGTEGEHCPLETYNVRNVLLRCANQEEALALYKTIENKKDNFVVNWINYQTQLQLVEAQLGFKPIKIKLS